MDVAYLHATWGLLDRSTLVDFLNTQERTVFATISGAHLYGFASRDSDVDLRGVFLLPLAAVLGLHPPAETVTRASSHPIDLDWVAHDLRKFARLMTRHNGYVLEQLVSPLVVATSPLHEELRELGRGCVTRPTAGHYLGFGRGRCKRLEEPAPTVKHLLYAYRVFMTGIHAMRTGEIVAHLPTLNQEFRDAEVDGLIARKCAGQEVMALAPSEVEHHGDRLRVLGERLVQAQRDSHLPDEVTTKADLDDLVVRARLSAPADA